MSTKPPVIRTHKYFCSAGQKHCCIISIHEGVVPNTCKDAENEHKLTNWQKTEEIFGFTVFGKKDGNMNSSLSWTKDGLCINIGGHWLDAEETNDE